MHKIMVALAGRKLERRSTNNCRLVYSARFAMNRHGNQAVVVVMGALMVAMFHSNTLPSKESSSIMGANSNWHEDENPSASEPRKNMPSFSYRMTLSSNPDKALGVLTELSGRDQSGLAYNISRSPITRSTSGFPVGKMPEVHATDGRIIASRSLDSLLA